MAASQMAMIARDRTLSSKSCRRSSTASNTCSTGWKEKKRHYAFRRQFNEKPSIIPGCPAPAAQGAYIALASHTLHLFKILSSTDRTCNVMASLLGGMCVWGSGVSPHQNRNALLWGMHCNVKQQRYLSHHVKITAGQNNCRRMGQHHRMHSKPQDHSEWTSTVLSIFVQCSQ